MKYIKIIFFTYLITLAGGAFAYKVESKDCSVIVDDSFIEKQCEVTVSEVTHGKYPITGVPEELKYNINKNLLLKGVRGLNEPQEFHRERFEIISLKEIGSLTVLSRFRVWYITFNGKEFLGTSKLIVSNDDLIVGIVIGLFLCLILALIVISVAKSRKSTSYH